MTQVKTADKDGYAAVQVGAGRQAGAPGSRWAPQQRFAGARSVQNPHHAATCACRPALQVGYKVCREDKITKPEVGHLNKAGVPAMKHLREFKVGWKRAAGRARQCAQRASALQQHCRPAAFLSCSLAASSAHAGQGCERL